MANPVGNKLTLFFRYADDGWSENYFTSSGTQRGLLDQVTAPKGLIEARLKLCGNGVSVDTARVSNLDPTRDSLEEYLNWGVGLGYSKTISPAAAGDADAGWTRVLFQLIATPAQKGRIFAGGMLDKFIDPSVQRFEPTDAWINAFNAYGLILENQFALKVQSNTGASAPIKVASVSASGGNVLRLKLVSVPAGWDGNTILLSKAKYTQPVIPLPHGRFIAQAVSGDPLSFDLPATYGAPGLNSATLTSYIAQSANARLLNYILAPITDTSYGRVVSHRVGRPFGLSVGRRRRR